MLQEEGISFRVEPSRFEERGRRPSAEETALSFARGKAEEVFSRFPGAFVLGADTVVALDGEILGKPKDGEDAKRMLRRLSGRTHFVCSGVCLLGPGVRLEDVVRTQVTFRDLSEPLIEEYVRSGLPLDKAGAYGIQDGYDLVSSYEGSYTNIVGLPMELVLSYLKEVRIQ